MALGLALTVVWPTCSSVVSLYTEQVYEVGGLRAGGSTL